jgi:hypothetical protein
MSPVFLLVASVVIGGAVRFAILPMVRRLYGSGRHNPSLTSIGIVGALEATASLATLLAISAGSVVLALLGYDAWLRYSEQDIGIERVQSLIGVVRSAEAALHDMHVGTLVLLVASLSAGMLYLAWRGRRAHFTSLMAKERAAQFQVMLQQWQNGSLPHLEPTPQMKIVVQEIAKCDEVIANRRGLHTTASIEQAKRMRDQLVQQLLMLDLDRRIEFWLDPSTIVYAPAKGWRSLLGSFFVGRGLLQAYGRFARLTFVLASLLYVPAAVALIGGPSGQTRLAATLDDLESIRIGLIRSEEQTLFARVADEKEADARNSGPKEAPPQNAPSESDADIASRDWCTEQTQQCDTLAVQRLSMAFEQVYLDRLSKRIDGGGPGGGGTSGDGRDSEGGGGRRAPAPALEPKATALHSINGYASQRATKIDFTDVLFGLRPDTPSSPNPPAPDQPPPPSPGKPPPGTGPASVQKGNDPGPPPTPTSGAGGDGLARSLAEEHLRSLDPGHNTPVREAFQRFLSEELVTKRPGAWQALKASLAGYQQAFRELPTRASVKSGLVMRVVSLGLSAAISGTLDADFDQLMRQQLDATHPASFDIQSRDFMKELLNSGDINQASAYLEQGPAELDGLRSRDVAELQRVAVRINSLSEASEKVITDRPAALHRLGDAIDATRIDSILSDGGLPRTARSMNIVGFRDIFPPGAANGGDASGPRSPGPGPQGRPGGLSAAYDFAHMRVNNKVGGVVFGRPPESRGTNLDFRDLTWRSTGSQVLLRFTRGDGARLEVGPFDRQIVHLALAYVADGRLVSATVINTSPLRDQKVVLHPAVLDTALGCRILAMDKYVFDLTEGDAAVAEAMRQITGVQDVFRMAWAARADGLVAATKRTNVKVNGLWLTNPEEYVRARSILPDGSELQSLLDKLDPPLALSFIDAKPEFFDKGLAGSLRKCVATSRKLGEVQACMRQSAGPIVENATRPISPRLPATRRQSIEKILRGSDDSLSQATERSVEEILAPLQGRQSQTTQASESLIDS